MTERRERACAVKLALCSLLSPAEPDGSLAGDEGQRLDAYYGSDCRQCRVGYDAADNAADDEHSQDKPTVGDSDDGGQTDNRINGNSYDVRGRHGISLWGVVSLAGVNPSLMPLGASQGRSR